MKRTLFLIIFTLVLLTSFIACKSQSINQITGRCTSPFQLQYSKIEVRANGDIYQTPCGTRVNTFFGNVDFSNATVTGLSGSGFVSGTGTTGMLPVWTGANTLGDSVFGSSAGSMNIFTFGVSNWYAYMNQGGGGAGFTVSNLAQDKFIGLIPASLYLQHTSVNVGDVQQTQNGTKLAIDDSARTINMTNTTGSTFSFSPFFETVNFSGTANTFEFDVGGGSFSVTTAGLDNILFNWAGVKTYNFQRTITAGGTTGSQVINKPFGTVNAAAAATSIAVTNDSVTTSSIVFAVARTNDATCSVKNVVPLNGSFTINFTAGCTAETSFGFFVSN